MDRNATVNKWAEQHIARPILFQPLSVNKPVLMIAGFILLVIAGFIVYGTIDMFFTELNKEGTYNWTSLVIAIIIIIGCVLLLRLLRKRRKMVIIKIDSTGITTLSGAFFKWNELQEIVFDVAYKKNGVPKEERVTGIRFYFPNERLYTKYVMPNFQLMLVLAMQVPVQKKNRFTGEYYY